MLTDIGAEEHKSRVAAELLNFVLMTTASRKLSMRAVKLGKKLEHALFAGTPPSSSGACLGNSSRQVDIH